ncbi:MAG: cadherin-like beta sandwich domain-containing protein [bacterium]|nr:cadherin-like beta sandwich domain-containing protein [bacterium]
MKKKFIKLLLFLGFFIPVFVNAASGSYSITANSNVEVGDAFSVKFTISSNRLFYWQSYITYDTSKLTLISGSTNFQGESDDATKGQSSVSQTLKFKAKATGTAWIAIAPGDMGNNINTDSQEISFSKKTKNISINEKKVVNYSSDNNLKSLQVEGYDLSPSFSKDTKEYNVTLPNNVSSINIKATTNDSKAKVSGIGNIKVTEGTNKIVISVKAENGNTKEYIINATVKELDPIEVQVDGKKYTVIRKKEQLPSVSSTYQYSTSTINNVEVPSLTSEITKYTLVGLKDENSNTNLYIYFKSNNSFTLYKEQTFNKLTIIPIDKETKNIPNGYKKSTITINEIEVKAYLKDNNYPLFYGLNIETGKENIYSYDKEENTIQIYKQDVTNSNNYLAKTSQDNQKLYIYVITLLGGILVLTYLVILANLIKKAKKNKNKEKKN